MTSQLLVGGDLFVEIVDNADASGTPKRDEARLAAIRDGTFKHGPFRFDRYNGYNGIRQLFNRKGPTENIFGTSGGSSLNFEFVYDVAGSSMRPRWIDGRPEAAPTPSTLVRIDETTAALETNVEPPSQVDVRTTFTVVPPCYVDLTTTIRPHPGSFTGSWLGLFWACYIRAPEKRTTHMRTRREPGGPTGWMPTLVQEPHDARAFASEHELDLLPNEPDPSGRLLHNIRPERFVEPVVYGRWRDMVLAMMVKTDDHLRFAIQPTGGGKGNPAWDFGIVIKDCVPNGTYRWQGRLVFKPYDSPGDVWKEYLDWQSTVII